MKQIKWRPLERGDRVRVRGFDIAGSDVTDKIAVVQTQYSWVRAGFVLVGIDSAFHTVHRCQLRKIVKKEKKEPKRIWVWFTYDGDLADTKTYRPYVPGGCEHRSSDAHYNSCFDSDYKEFVEVVKK